MSDRQAETTTAEPARRGFGPLRCISCGEEGVIRLDLDDCATLHCTDCEAEFGLDDVRALIAKWQRVVDWLDATAPTLCDV
jgi:transcription elongation factor Elf1